MERISRRHVVLQSHSGPRSHYSCTLVLVDTHHLTTPEIDRPGQHRAAWVWTTTAHLHFGDHVTLRTLLDGYATAHPPVDRGVGDGARLPRGLPDPHLAAPRDGRRCRCDAWTVDGRSSLPRLRCHIHWPGCTHSASPLKPRQPRWHRAAYTMYYVCNCSSSQCWQAQEPQRRHQATSDERSPQATLHCGNRLQVWSK